MDKECIRMLNGLEKTLERKVPERRVAQAKLCLPVDMHGQPAVSPWHPGVNDEPLPQGWPIAEE